MHCQQTACEHWTPAPHQHHTSTTQHHTAPHSTTPHSTTDSVLSRDLLQTSATRTFWNTPCHTHPSHTTSALTPPTPPVHSPLPHHHHTHPSHTTSALTPPTPPVHSPLPHHQCTHPSHTTITLTPPTPPVHSPLPHHHHTHLSHATITLTPPTPPVHLPGSPCCSGDTSTCHFCSCDHRGNTSKNTAHPPVAQPTATAPALSRRWEALLVVGPSTQGTRGGCTASASTLSTRLLLNRLRSDDNTQVLPHSTH